MTTPWEVPGARECFKVGTPLVFAAARSTHDGEIVALLDDEHVGRAYLVQSWERYRGWRLDVGVSIIRDDLPDGTRCPVLCCHLGQAYAKDRPLPAWVVERMTRPSEAP